MITLFVRLNVLLLLLTTGVALNGEERPASPWNLEALFKAPACEWLDQTSPVRSLLYTGEPFQGKPTQVFAWYASPESIGDPSVKPGQKHPGIVLIHGGGGTAFKQWAELWAKRGYVAIAMDLGGMQPDAVDAVQRARLALGGPHQDADGKFVSIKTEDTSDDWPYHAVANCILAHSLLLSLPEVDATRTAVTGISWGGYATCIVASLDDRFKAAVPVYGCGYIAESSSWHQEMSGLTEDETRRWTSLYDPAVYLPRCKVPMFFVNGTNDRWYQLDSHMKSYQAVKAPKNIRVQINMPHGHEEGWAPKEIGLYIDSVLDVRAEKALPACGVPEIKGAEVVATVSGDAIKAATLNYALPGTAVNNREWRTVPARVEKGTVTATAPPADSDICFFAVTDDRGAMVSSEVVFVQR